MMWGLTGLLLLLETDHFQAQLSLCLLHIYCMKTMLIKIKLEITLEKCMLHTA